MILVYVAISSCRGLHGAEHPHILQDFPTHSVILQGCACTLTCSHFLDSLLYVRCRGGYWASLRAAMQPLFHTAALHSYSPIFNEAAGKLAAQLQSAGEGGQAVELHSLLGGMTMRAIGETAFG